MQSELSRDSRVHRTLSDGLIERIVRRELKTREGEERNKLLDRGLRKRRIGIDQLVI